MKPLNDKLAALLIQLPSYIKITEGMEALKQYNFFFDDSFRYALEIRHPSWFSDLACNFFSDNKICMVWNQLDRIMSPPVVRSDSIYLRLIGNRSIKEGDFGNIQKDREQEMEYWSDKFKVTQESSLECETLMVVKLDID